MANNRNAAQRALAVLMAVLLLLSVSSVLAPITVSAASLTVTNGGDDGPGSLRALLASASDGDTVNFAPGVTAVTLTSGPIGFSQSNFTIDGGTGVTIRRDSTTNFTLLQSWAPITSTLTLKGLTLENGYTTAYTGGNLAVQGNANLMNCSFNDAGYGGAVYVGRNAELTNCDFDNNKATSYGGALYVGYSAKLTNCHFSNNQSTNYGGALYVADLASNGVSELTDCSFVGNQTTGSQIYGGAVYFTGASKVTRCVFTNNKATREGGGLHGYGSTELTGCSFSGNEATRGGGGAVLFGVSTLLGCTFTNNSAGTYFGGGADVAGAAKLTNCIFNGNTAGSGGGLYVSEYGAAASYAVLTGCVFAGNQARYNGAAVVAGAASTLLAIANSTISGNITSANGGAIANGERSYLFHTTITKNQGGGYYTDGTRPAYIYNSILAGNTDAAGTTLRQYNDNGNTCRFFNSLIEGEDGVTYQKIFGVNAFDSATSTHKVLGNGIAVGISESITTGDVYGLSGLNTAQQALISGAVTALANDQVGAARPGTGRTCGAVEATANTLTGVAVTTQPTKASYTVGEALVLAGTQLTLTYSNGATEVIDYNEPGVTNDAAANITATVGGKTIKFTFLGVDTAPTAGANITVTGGTPPIAPGITGPTTMSLQTGYAATFTGAYSVTGTAPVSVSKISGNLAITWNATEKRLDIATGLLAGTYPVELLASNDTAPDATINFTLTVTDPPIAPGITGPTTMSLQTGYAATFTGAYSVTGTAPVSVSKISGNLAITWNATEKRLDIATGLLAGTYPVELLASNGISPDATINFTLTVTDPPIAPGITGPTTMSLQTGYAATFTGAYSVTGTAPVTITKTNGDAAITWNATEMRLDIAAGLAAGSYPVVLTASNGTAPDAAITFTLTVTNAPVAPGITGPTTMSLQTGYAATFTGAYTVTGTAPVTITKTNGDAAITWNATEMRLDIAAGLAAGSYPVVLTASNGTAPDATITFTLTVTNAPVAPGITGPTTMSLQTGYAATFTGAYSVAGTAPVTVTKTSGDAAITWNATEMRLDIAAGLAAGSYPVVLTASNGTAPDATITFTLTVTNTMAVIPLTGTIKRENICWKLLLHIITFSIMHKEFQRVTITPDNASVQVEYYIGKKCMTDEQLANVAWKPYVASFRFHPPLFCPKTVYARLTDGQGNAAIICK